MNVKGFHNSGRWDRSDESLERNVRRLRRDGRSFGTRTEMNSRSFHDELHWPEDGWGHYHPMTDWGKANCSVEWEWDTWALVEQGTQVLTDIRVRTKGGHLLPPSVLVWVLLEHKATRRKLDLSTAHMNLHNTPLRNRAWHEEARTLNTRFKGLHRKHPDWELAYQADVNRTQRLKMNQRMLREITNGTGMRNLWVGNLPARGGTHGKRAILDAALTTTPGRIYLLPDDASSDHRPFGVTYELKRAS